MSDDETALDADLGRATIVYDHPEEGTAELTVENEHVAYFQDHWTVKTGEDDEGNDVVRRIPARRVYYVERSVEAFEEEIKSVKTQVQSVAEELRSRLPVGGDRETDRGGEGGGPIDIQTDGDEGNTSED